MEGHLKDSNQNPVQVQVFQLDSNGQIQVYLSNGTKYIYDHVNLKQWKVLPDISEVGPQDNPVTVEPTLAGYEINNAGRRDS